jgi:hypothetical protein
MYDFTSRLKQPFTSKNIHIGYVRAIVEWCFECRICVNVTKMWWLGVALNLLRLGNTRILSLSLASSQISGDLGPKTLKYRY